ncbi:MAG: hypothetical protein QOK17_2202 [Sphingomonadales bacterium]|jgi:hypothetical protein|nr:hypothetical protein [Sphingomonadales bacterium]
MSKRHAPIADRASATLRAEPHGSKVAKIAELAIEMQGELGDCPTYLAALAEALEREPPPFDSEAYETIYREAANDERWMAVSLLTNSEREGDGSRRLWSLAAFSQDDDERQKLKRHAVDESKHALMYLALVNLAFPDAVSPDFRIELRQLSPGFGMHKELRAVPGNPYAKAPTIDDFVQMNIAEIRTTIHHVLQRQALALHCPPGNASQVKRLQDCLLRDELAHVSYTARLIERLTRHLDPSRVADLFARRFHDFNQITREELGDDAFDCSVACCAKREWCRAKAGPVQPAFLDS